MLPRSTFKNKKVEFLARKFVDECFCVKKTSAIPLQLESTVESSIKRDSNGVKKYPALYKKYEANIVSEGGKMASLIIFQKWKI